MDSFLVVPVGINHWAGFTWAACTQQSTRLLALTVVFQSHRALSAAELKAAVGCSAESQLRSGPDCHRDPLPAIHIRQAEELFEAMSRQHRVGMRLEAPALGFPVVLWQELARLRQACRFLRLPKAAEATSPKP